MAEADIFLALIKGFFDRLYVLGCVGWRKKKGGVSTVRYIGLRVHLTVFEACFSLTTVGELLAMVGMIINSSTW